MEKELTDVGREGALRCTAVLSSMFASLPASCLLSTCSPGPIPGWRGTLFYGPPARPLAPLRCTLLVHHHDPMCPLRVNLRAWVSAPHAQLDTASSVTTNSLTGCVGLAANGAGPRRCTAGATPASVRTRDRRTEARTGPGPLYPRNGRPHPGFPGVT